MRKRRKVGAGQRSGRPSKEKKMRILVFEPRVNRHEKVRKAMTEYCFHELQDAEFFFTSTYNSSWLGEYPKHGDFDVVIITETLMNNGDYRDFNRWGMVAATEAGKKGIPCFVGLPEAGHAWLYHMLHYASVHTFTRHEETYDIGFSAYNLCVLIMNVLAGIPVTS